MVAQMQLLEVAEVEVCNRLWLEEGVEDMHVQETVHCLAVVAIAACGEHRHLLQIGQRTELQGRHRRRLAGQMMAL
jgi:hypothetical protein